VCPICRKNLTSDHLVYMQETTPGAVPAPAQEVSTLPSKMDVLRHILSLYPNGKFIVFSAYNETFDRIRDVLMEMDIGFGELNGRAEARLRVIDDFRNGITPVLFLNCIQNGAGENLREATDVILYHEMNEHMRAQVVGRAYRIGRQEPLRVHHLRSVS